MAAADSKVAHFVLPDLLDNQDGWGPSAIPSAYDDIPFAPFNKNDPIGRISDWTNTRAYFPRGRGRQFGQGLTEVFSYQHKDDDSSFSLVDNTPKFKPRDGRRKFKKFSVHNRRRRGRGYRPWGMQPGIGRGNKRTRGGGDRGRGRGGRGGRYGSNFGQPEMKEASVMIDEDWGDPEDVIEFDELKNERIGEPQPTLITSCGRLDQYNISFDTVSPRTNVNLKRFDAHASNPTTSSDPIMRRLMDSKEGNIYATDSILAVLMASTRSVAPWDILVQVTESGDIILDKRPASRIDTLTVNENWNELLESDPINHPEALGSEATLIQHNFVQQVLKHDSKTEHKFLEPSPSPLCDAVSSSGAAPSAAAAASVPHVGYRYRRWNVGGIKLVARCAINAYAQRKGEKLFLQLRALNEFDSKLSGGIDWRQKLEHQPGAVLANELKNNSNKLVRWAAESMLSGADEIRLGFVSRVHSKEPNRHQILASKRYSPVAFADSVNVKASNLWGVLRSILERLRDLEAGNYILLKDPNGPKLLLYEIGDYNFDEAQDDRK